MGRACSDAAGKQHVHTDTWLDAPGGMAHACWVARWQVRGRCRLGSLLSSTEAPVLGGLGLFPRQEGREREACFQGDGWPFPLPPSQGA